MKKLFFVTDKAAAVYSGAMEPETIKKNGAQPKSLISRINLKNKYII